EDDCRKRSHSAGVLKFSRWSGQSVGPSLAVRAFCCVKNENGRVTMDDNRHVRSAANPGHRAILGFAALGATLPLGAMAPASWRVTRPRLDAPICRAAAEAVAPGNTPREIRLCWGATAVCHTGIAAADQQGFFAKRNLRVERINFGGAADQLLEMLA